MSKNYWSNTQEQLVINLKLSTCQREKTRLFLALQPALYKMITSIINRYYSTYAEEANIEEEVNDAYTFVYSIIDKYDPEKAKAYSFIGTSLKHHFYDQFVLRKGYTIEQIDSAAFTATYDPQESREDRIDELRERVIKRIAGSIKTLEQEKIEDETVRQNELLILRTLLTFFRQHRYFNKHVITYYLMKTTTLAQNTLFHYLSKHNLQEVIIRKYKLTHYENIIREYEQQTGRRDETKALLEAKYTKRTDKELYKVQHKRKSQALYPVRSMFT